MVYSANPISQEQLQRAINAQLEESGLPTDSVRLINMIRTYAPVPEFYVNVGNKTFESGTEYAVLSPLLSNDMSIDGEEQDDWYYTMIEDLGNAGFETFYIVTVFVDTSVFSFSTDVTELDSLEALIWNRASGHDLDVPLGWYIMAYSPAYSTDDVSIPSGASIKLMPLANGLV